MRKNSILQNNSRLIQFGVEQEVLIVISDCLRTLLLYKGFETMTITVTLQVVAAVGVAIYIYGVLISDDPSR